MPLLNTNSPYWGSINGPNLCSPLSFLPHYPMSFQETEPSLCLNAELSDFFYLSLRTLYLHNSLKPLTLKTFLKCHVLHLAFPTVSQEASAKFPQTLSFPLTVPNSLWIPVYLFYSETTTTVHFLKTQLWLHVTTKAKKKVSLHKNLVKTSTE